jgi:hypothetical protein
MCCVGVRCLYTAWNFAFIIFSLWLCPQHWASALQFHGLYSSSFPYLPNDGEVSSVNAST